MSKNVASSPKSGEGGSKSKMRGQCYRQLGAPVLLYRNKDCYTVQDHPVVSSMVPKEDASKMHQLLASRQRVQGLWHYPDTEAFHQHEKHSIDGSQRDSSDTEGDVSSDRQEKYGQTFKMAERMAWDMEEAMEDLTLQKMDSQDPTDQQTIDIRSQVLIRSGVQEPHHRLARRLKRLQNIESKTVLHTQDPSNKSIQPAKRWSGEQLQNVAHGQRQYLMESDPAYMAPIQEGLLAWALDDNTNGNYNSDTDDSQSLGSSEDDTSPSDQSYDGPGKSSYMGRLEDPDEDTKRRGTKTAHASMDELAFENQIGNCIACFSCLCQDCLDHPTSRTSWILHPVGSFLDRLRISHIKFPSDKLLDYRGRQFSQCREVPLGERIWQLCQCAPTKYVARTTNKCILLEVGIEAMVDCDSYAGCKGSFLSLSILSVVDLSRSGESPRYLASHPKYGRKFTDPRVATLVKGSGCSGCNVIKLIDFGFEPRASNHTITNLQNMSLLEFQRSHPMLLWSAAQSYIRNTVNKNMIGHGHSLYSIDLRTNRASVFLSPSRLDFLAEGSLSVSGISCDWDSPNRLFVSSISANRTWELDTRMPSQVVNSWHLPHACEGAAGRASIAGLKGTNFLFCHQNWDDETKMPFMGVNTAPGSYGVHLYQRAFRQPYLDTLSFECANVGRSSKAEVEGIASSSTFALPDVSTDTFCCGLSCFRIPRNDDVRKFMPRQAAEDITGLILATATSKGDLYVHHLVESKSPIDTDTMPAGQLVGTNALPVVEAKPKVPTNLTHSTSRVQVSNSKPIMESLEVTWSNDFPLPSKAILKTNEPEAKTAFSHLTNTKTQTTQNATEGRSEERFSVPMSPFVPFQAQLVNPERQDDPPRQVMLSRNFANNALDVQESALDCFQSAEHDFDPNFSQSGDAAFDIADAKSQWEQQDLTDTKVSTYSENETRESIAQADADRWEVQQKLAQNDDSYSSDREEAGSDAPPFEWVEDESLLDVEKESDKNATFEDSDDEAAGKILVGEDCEEARAIDLDLDEGRYSDTDDERSYSS